MFMRSAFVVASMFAATVCFATAKADAIAIDPQEFAEARADIEAAISKTERYSELTRTQREQLDETLDRMEKTLSSVTSIDALDGPAKTQLYNDQEVVNTMLTEAAEDSRQICKREKRVGSHRITNQCMTVGERRRVREMAEREQVKLQRGARGGESLIPGYSGGDR